TTYLTPAEVDRLFEVIRGLARDGVSAVFISHKLREVAAHCDEVTVLRRGRTTARFTDRPFDLAAIGRSMTGGERAPGDNGANATNSVQRSAMRRDGRSRMSAAHGMLRLAAGEIVGVAGVAGNGQEELVAALAGLRQDRRYWPVAIDGVE